MCYKMLFSTPLLFIFLYILKKKKDKNKKNDCGYVDKKEGTYFMLCVSTFPRFLSTFFLISST